MVAGNSAPEFKISHNSLHRTWRYTANTKLYYQYLNILLIIRNTKVYSRVRKRRGVLISKSLVGKHLKINKRAEGG